MPCVHEIELIGFVKGVDENIACREAAEGHPGSDDSDKDFTTNRMSLLEGCTENSSDVVQDSNIYYTYRQKRSCFPGSAEENSVRR